MNREFNILWIEDEVKWYNSEKNHVKTTLDSFGFKANINRLKDSTSLFTDDTRPSFGKYDYDLILMDYNLKKSDENGALILEKFRNANILTDALFYSMDYDRMVMLAIEKKIDGLYFAYRQDFRNKLNAVLEKLIRKSEDIVHCRGFILDNTADFETRTEKIIQMSISLFNGNDRDKLIKSIFSTIDIKLNTMNENISGLRQNLFTCQNDCTNDNLSTIIQDNEGKGLTHTNRLNILNCIIDILSNGTYGFMKKTEHENFKSYYKDNIQCVRNSSGHTVNTSINSNGFIEHRKEILKCHDLLSDIEKCLDHISESNNEMTK